MQVNELSNKTEKVGPILQVKIIAGLLDRKGKAGTCVAIAIYSDLDF